jgi:hypothetical protein
LPDGIKDTIRKSPEWHELQRKGGGEEAAAAMGKRSNPYDDEIPF